MTAFDCLKPLVLLVGVSAWPLVCEWLFLPDHTALYLAAALFGSLCWLVGWGMWIDPVTKDKKS